MAIPILYTDEADVAELTAVAFVAGSHGGVADVEIQDDGTGVVQLEDGSQIELSQDAALALTCIRAMGGEGDVPRLP